MPVVIPANVDATRPRIVQRTSLDGVPFILRLAWNGRLGRWVLGVYDADDVAIATALPVVVSWPLLRLVVDERRPAGDIVCVDRTGALADPGLASFAGGSHVLTYWTRAELVPDG